MQGDELMTEKISSAQLLQLARQMRSQQMEGAQQMEQLAQTGLSDQQQVQLHSVMKDQAKLAQLLTSPQARALMEKLNSQQ
jgi:hypothetical protein